MSDFASESGNWYEWSGKPAYEVLGRNGEMRRTTLRDARKYGYLPSFSGIWAIMARESLEKWKRNELALVFAATPRLPEEGDQGYIDRVMELYEAKLAEAPDRGTDIHGCIERHLTGQDYDQSYANHVMGAVAAIDRWCGVGGLSTEKSFACALGYGGKCDLHKRVSDQTLPFYGDWIADYKTKEFGETNLPGVYDNHFGQLAAYRNGLGMPDARCAIIYISTLVPGLTHTIEIPEKDLQHGWKVFCAAFELWKVVKKYDPCKRKELTNGRNECDREIREPARTSVQDGFDQNY